MRTKEKNIDKSFIFVLITAFCFGTMEIALKLGGGSFSALQKQQNQKNASGTKKPETHKVPGCKRKVLQDVLTRNTHRAPGACTE